MICAGYYLKKIYIQMSKNGAFVFMGPAEKFCEESLFRVALQIIANTAS